MSLIDLYHHHKGKASDKWSLYLDIYDVLFKEFINKPIALLEIGIQNGGSLEIWGQYFTQFENIVGCDIDENCKNLTYDNSRISVIVGDCNLESTQKQITEIVSAFDIIIDDGSHLSGDIIKSFSYFFPKLKEDGIYIIEDLHCSYWKPFEGGLFNALSSIAFFKRLADIINAEHWNIDNHISGLLEDFFIHYHCSINNENLAYIHSISFYNSVCVIRKKNPNKNLLNQRILAGNSFQICKNDQDTEILRKIFEKFKIDSHSHLNNLFEDKMALDQEFSKLINEYNDLKIEHQNLLTLNAKLITDNNMLINQYQALLEIKNAMLLSKSWILTKPLRYINNKITRLKNKIVTIFSLNLGK